MSHDLGPLGAEQGEPVVFQWRWYDNAPMLPLWLGLALLLVVPGQNRNWQAWTILVLPLGAAVLQLLFFLPGLGQSAGFDSFVQFTMTLAVAWSAVWLLVPYLATRTRTAGLFSSLAVMLAAGLIAYVGYFGAWVSLEHVAVILLWCIACVALVGGIMRSGRSCRAAYHPSKVALWLMVWLPLIPAVCMAGFFGFVVLSAGAHLGPFLIVTMAVSLAFATVFAAGFLYALGAPVVLLAALTDCYGRRMRRLVLQEAEPPEPS